MASYETMLDLTEDEEPEPIYNSKYSSRPKSSGIDWSTYEEDEDTGFSSYSIPEIKSPKMTYPVVEEYEEEEASPAFDWGSLFDTSLSDSFDDDDFEKELARTKKEKSVENNFSVDWSSFGKSSYW